MEPTKRQLQASAGWTLMKRQETTPEHAVALDKYRDGCEALLPFAPETTGAERTSNRVEEVKLPARPESSPSRFETVPNWARVDETGKPVGECRTKSDHKFNIHTQRCVYCDMTRRAALGRDPELMVM